jgi:hypothetical protein
MAELYQCTMEWALPAGDVAQTGVWWLVGDGADPASVVGAFQSEFVDSLWPSGSGGVKGEYTAATVLQRLASRQVNVSTGATIATAEALVNRPGSGSGTPLPAEVSVCISLRTASAGASGRGRAYMPAPATGALSATGGLEAGHADTFAEEFCLAVIALNDYASFVTSSVGVYSRKNNAVAAVTTVRCGTVFDSQRRRRNGYGESYATYAVA